MAGEEVPGFGWIPSGQVYGRAVLKGVADRVQHIGFDPEGVAGFAGPDTQPVRGGRLAGGSPDDDFAGVIRVRRAAAPDTAQRVALVSIRVTFLECEAVGEILDGIAVEIDLKFVHALRVVARRRNGAEDGVAEIDHEDGACLSAEQIEVCDIEPDILPGDW